MKLLAISVTPSPYQRDFFREVATLGDCQLEVAYLERAPGDTPWQTGDLEPWESVLQGSVWGKGRVRCHWNSPLPDLAAYDRVILNAPITGVTTQRLFRCLSRRTSPPWAFWGEQLLSRTGWRRIAQTMLTAPLANAEAIVAIGSTARDDYRRRFPSQNVYDIPYACSLRDFVAAARNRTPSNSCRFLFAGQMIARKGVDLLLQAFQLIILDGIDARLTLVGREGDLPQWIAGLNPETRTRIDYLGFKQPADLPAIFAAADVFILPSRHDGWGVVVNQALGAGLPVITSTAAGAGRDLVTHGGSGLHVEPGAVGSLYQAMTLLATQPETRAAMAAEASLKAAEIGPEAAGRRWMDVLRQGS